MSSTPSEGESDDGVAISPSMKQHKEVLQKKMEEAKEE